MNYGIALTPAIPMRSEPSETAEMTNQLLFGECFRILEEKPRWLLIEHIYDGYQGWIDWKMATLVDEYFIQWQAKQPVFMVRQPIADLKRKGDKHPIRISIGTMLPGYDPVKQSFKVNDVIFSLPRRAVQEVGQSHLRALLRTAEFYLNTSYLWGGRSILGIDCSGFVQVVFRLHGIDLPRNASQQVLHGEPVCSFEDIYPGDLAFFQNDMGKITHVGIVYTPNSIIHSSGDVHIDKLTSEGIWSHRLNCYSHSTPILRRFPQLNKRENKE